jgi:beta-glucosidase
MNTKESATLRASQLLKKLSLNQKLTMVHEGFDPGPGYGAAGYVSGIPALCLPPLFLNDAGSGVADSQVMVNSYPAEIAQAATWDPTLQRQLGASIGAEAHAKGVDVLLAPDLNLVRTPLGGRTSEEYGEDPYLTAEMGDAFIRGVQRQHVIATAKQFVANDQEVDRSSANETISQRVLKEIYEAPFNAAVTQAKVGAVMCAYNQVNGTHSCQNPALLTGDLAKMDKFRGFIVSDWSATNSAIASANAGLDLEMNLQQASNAVRYQTVPAEQAEK